MEDKTSTYMMIIVGIVALVGIIVLLSGGNNGSAADNSGNTITGEVTYYDGDMVVSGFAKVLFTLFLLGVAGFMYFRRD